MRRRSSGSAARRRSAAARSRTACSGVCAGTLTPAWSVTCRDGAPRSRQTTGRPAAMASRHAPPPASCRPVCTRRWHSRSTAATSARGISPQKRTRSAMPARRASARNRRRCGPPPTIQYSASGSAASANARKPRARPPPRRKRPMLTSRIGGSDGKGRRASASISSAPRPDSPRSSTRPAPSACAFAAVSLVIARTIALRRAVSRTRGSHSAIRRASAPNRALIRPGRSPSERKLRGVDSAPARGPQTNGGGSRASRLGVA
jgi:hypothetical protein